MTYYLLHFIFIIIIFIFIKTTQWKDDCAMFSVNKKINSYLLRIDKSVVLRYGKYTQDDDLTVDQLNAATL